MNNYLISVKLLYIALFLLLSCSPKLRVKREFSPLGLNEIQCTHKRVLLDPIIKKIEDLEAKSLQFSPLGLGIVGQGLIPEATADLTPLFPQIMSIKKFQDSYNYLREILDKKGEDGLLLKNHYFGKSKIEVFQFEDNAFVNDYVYSVDRLVQLAKRFGAKSCNLAYLKTNKSKDVREFFEASHALVEVPQNNLKLKEHFSKICSKLGESCKDNWKEDPKRYLEEYRLKFLEPLFKIGTWGFKRHIKCEQIQGVTKISFPSKSKDLEVIKRFWDEPELLEINFFSHNEGIEIHEEDSNVSYVSHDSPNIIHLKKGLNKMLRSRIIAHEFGHVLGFEDCYIEFYNDQKEIIYYEIDKSNLMCSTNEMAKITTQQRKELIKRYCPNL